MPELPSKFASLPLSIHRLLQIQTHADGDKGHRSAPLVTHSAGRSKAPPQGSTWSALEQLVRLMTDCAGSRMSIRRTFAIHTILQDLCESDDLPYAFREAVTELSDEWAIMHHTLLRRSV